MTSDSAICIQRMGIIHRQSHEEIPYSTMVFNSRPILFWSSDMGLLFRNTYPLQK